MKKLLFIIFFAFSLCASEIKIAVDTTLKHAINELITEFNKEHINLKVDLTLSNSENIFAQIRNGKTFGIFMSANAKYPQKLYELGLASTKPIEYAKGALVVVSKHDFKYSNNLDFLKDKNIRSILIPNPDTSPYGEAITNSFKSAKIYTNIKKKLIYAQKTSQALKYTLNVANLGFFAKSALFSPKLKNKKLFFKDLDQSLYTPIRHDIVILHKQKDNKNVEAFYDFVLSKKAKEIFKKYGYLEN